VLAVIRIGSAIVVVVVVVAAVGAVAAVPGSGEPGARAGAKARMAQASPQQLEAQLLRTYEAFDANQGVAVDRSHFYAVDNTSITKHSRETGAPVLQFAGAEGGPLIHMDSGAAERGRLYAAHSNYNESPMESSVEVFDARTMQQLDTHSFGIDRGSLTWIDRAPDGSWWAGFANYDRVFDGQVYGDTDNTQVVKMNDRFEVIEGYTIPTEILDRFRPMSNSGGSWGPDGRLWITGHDLGEAYVMEPPRAGSELHWVATVSLPGVEGQGIAWDRSGPRPTLWAIKRSTKQVLQFEVPYRSIAEPPADDWRVNGPGEFEP
jgi:hypothetical protein